MWDLHAHARRVYFECAAQLASIGRAGWLFTFAVDLSRHFIVIYVKRVGGMLCRSCRRVAFAPSLVYNMNACVCVCVLLCRVLSVEFVSFRTFCVRARVLFVPIHRGIFPIFGCAPDVRRNIN